MCVCVLFAAAAVVFLFSFPVDFKNSKIEIPPTAGRFLLFNAFFFCLFLLPLTIFHSFVQPLYSMPACSFFLLLIFIFISSRSCFIFFHFQRPIESYVGDFFLTSSAVYVFIERKKERGDTIFFVCILAMRSLLMTIISSHGSFHQAHGVSGNVCVCG